MSGGVTRRMALAGFAALPLANASVHGAPLSQAVALSPTKWHNGYFGATSIVYGATAERRVARTSTGAPVAEIVTFSYERRDTKADRKRPVIFVFGGGPGASSYLHHLYFMGPRRLEWDPDRKRSRIVPNPHALLDLADIVFIDPAGTGLSTVLPGGEATSFSVGGDAQSFIDIIDDWLSSRRRLQAPVYLEGSSYGSVRAIRIASDLRFRRPLAGIFVTANSAMVQETLRDNGVLGPAVDLPTRALTAVHHGVVARSGRTDQQIIDEAYEYGASEYMGAIARRRELGAARSQQVAARLEALTGISAQDHLANGLIISWDKYSHLLLASRGLVLSDIHDSRTITRAGIVAASAPEPERKPLKTYLAQTFGVYVSHPEYVPANTELGNKWDYRGANGAPANDWPLMLQEVMRDVPGFVYYSASGFYDNLSTLGQARYLFSRFELPDKRAILRSYPGGHLIYQDPVTSDAMLDDMRVIIQGDIAQLMASGRPK